MVLEWLRRPLLCKLGQHTEPERMGVYRLNHNLLVGEGPKMQLLRCRRCEKLDWKWVV